MKCMWLFYIFFCLITVMKFVIPIFLINFISTYEKWYHFGGRLFLLLTTDIALNGIDFHIYFNEYNDNCIDSDTVYF